MGQFASRFVASEVEQLEVPATLRGLHERTLVEGSTDLVSVGVGTRGFGMLPKTHPKCAIVPSVGNTESRGWYVGQNWVIFSRLAFGFNGASVQRK